MRSILNLPFALRLLPMLFCAAIVFAQDAPKGARALRDWKAQIEAILKLNVPEAEVVERLKKLLPSLAVEGQVETAQHLCNLVTDADYEKLKPLTLDWRLPEEVLDVLFTDLMNRPDRIKLPVLLAIAKLKKHPYYDEALQDLKIFLDEDQGRDWQKWDEANPKLLKTAASPE